MFKNTLHVPL
jgi:hypothetical protein